MAKYSAAQIYAFARAAGFDPDQAVTMTAIALAESGGRSGAHNTANENSCGLWQINAHAHPELARGLDLFHPRDNAIAAFRVSNGGRDISPWTTTHGGVRARYTQFRQQAQAAAMAHGDAGGIGMWQGTSGYRDHVGAGSAHGGTGGPAVPSDPAGLSDHVPPSTTVDQPSPDQAADHGLALPQPGWAGPGLAAVTQPISVVAPGPEPESHGLALPEPEEPGEVRPFSSDPAPGGHPAPMTVSTRADAFVEAALDQRGDPYVFGAQVNLNNPDPKAFDCSELVRWAAHRAGTDLPDGSWLQFLELRRRGLVIPVEEGIRTKGALLFSFSSPPTVGGGRPVHSHVAISLGDESTIEARGHAYGVGIFAATKRRFQYAAVLPGMTQDTPSLHQAVADLPDSGAVPTGGRLLDTDGDGLGDRLERRLGLDPFQSDTDHDRLSDSYELLYGGTDPLAAHLGGSAWSPEVDQALFAGASTMHGLSLGTDPASPTPADVAGGDDHGLALVQPHTAASDAGWFELGSGASPSEPESLASVHHAADDGFDDSPNHHAGHCLTVVDDGSGHGSI